VLRELYEIRNVQEWSLIAHLMEQEYQIYGRTGKQCRERFTFI